MELFFQTALSFPVVILSFLLCLAILYWASAALGIFDIEVLDGGESLEGLAGVLLKVGLAGVPVTLVLTVLFFFAWLAAYFVELLLLQHLPLGVLRYPLGIVLIAAVLLLAVAPTRLLIAPLRPLFQRLEATDSRSLIGQTAVVRSGQVTADHGEAALADGGAGLILKVRGNPAEQLSRGDRVVLLEYLEAENAYRVISEAEFHGLPPMTRTHREPA